MKTNQTQILFKMPIIEEELEHLFFVFDNEKLLKSENFIELYPSSLDSEIEKLRKLNDKKIVAYFKNSIYNPEFYKKGIAKLNKHKQNIIKLIDVLKNDSYKFLEIFPEYTVRLTLFGTDGMYVYENQEIILKTSTQGIFNWGIVKTILHEVIHIGIEKRARETKMLQEKKEEIVNEIFDRKIKHLVDNESNN